MIKKIIKLLLYGGSFKMNDYEKWILITTAINAPFTLSQKINKQIEHVSYIQRNNENRIILITIDEEIQLIEPLGDSDGVCLAKIKFIHENKSYISKVYTVKGKLRTIESNKSIPNDISDKDLIFTSIEFFPQKRVKDYADIIDKQEHDTE
jgi:hypothetical protein